MTAVVILLVVGFALGWWCGSRWAELGRARTDINRVWRGRRDWRDRG